MLLWLSGKSACLGNGRYLVQIRAVPHFQIIFFFVIMLPRFICHNDFHPLSTISRGAVAYQLKRLSSKLETPGLNPGSASFSNHTLVCNYVYQVYLS